MMAARGDPAAGAGRPTRSMPRAWTGCAERSIRSRRASHRDPRRRTKTENRRDAVLRGFARVVNGSGDQLGAAWCCAAGRPEARARDGSPDCPCRTRLAIFRTASGPATSSGVRPRHRAGSRRAFARGCRKPASFRRFDPATRGAWAARGAIRCTRSGIYEHPVQAGELWTQPGGDDG